MLRFLCVVFFAFGLVVLAGKAQAQIYPQPGGYVVDQGGLIEEADKEKIRGWAKELEEKTTAQVAVVTVPTIGNETIEGYAVKLFEQWGIGQKGKDNGVLLVVAVQERVMRIEVGYGLEGALTDAKSSQIINGSIVPEFKASQFSAGITKGAWAIVSIVAAEYNVQISGQPDYPAVTVYQSPIFSIFWVIVGVVFLLAFFSMLFPRKRGPRNWHSGDWGSGGGFSGGGGGFGGGSSGGGFGGGRSGGGGASGRW